LNARTVIGPSGKPILRVVGKDKAGLTLTLLVHEGGDRREAEVALQGLLDEHWPT
jgi:ParB family transcriptional regulator, chromosome partitioning protein